ncbi:MAG: 6-bladed beta-propeller, partial [Bacteroides sp.]|nr:6-bladed beta-propeller [Bacteroides sp.]
LWTCDFSALKDTIVLPLSDIAEDLQVVKLDGSDEALVPTSNVLISEHYILVYGRQQTPFKLFDKSGKFLANVGSFGQGPGEYQLVYDAQIDESAGRVYILPWNAKALLAYNMEGQYTESIPLPTLVPKGKFKVDSRNSTLSVFILPFNHLPYVAWRQDLQGNLLDTIPGRHLAVHPDFSNEVFSNKVGGTFDVSLFTFFELRPDTLYHMEEGRLHPRFTMDFGGKDIPIHSYQELPHQFVGDVMVKKQVSEYTYTTEAPSYFIMDKKTLKGSFYKFVNDYLGNMPAYLSASSGYYTLNMEPGTLKEALEKHLEQKTDLSAKERERLRKLADSIQENDNNYILYAKLR